MWPLPGYWSYSELSAPVSCALPAACPGALVSPDSLPDGARTIAVCAEGYNGTSCTHCAAGCHSSLQQCLSCGLESAEKTQLSILLLLAVGLFFAVAAAVALLTATQLSVAVASTLLLQHLSVVGKLAGQLLSNHSSAWVSEMFSIVAMMNFDIEFVKSGCVVPAIPFLEVFWLTLGVIAFTSVMFIMAASILGCGQHRKHQQEAARVRRRADGSQEVGHGDGGREGSSNLAGKHENVAEPAEQSSVLAASPRAAGLRAFADHSFLSMFRARLIHSHLILGSILYLRLTAAAFQGVHCTDVPTESDGVLSVLEVDMTTLCYQGAHLWTAMILAWPLITFYSVGFPFFSAWLLYSRMRQAVLEQQVAEARMAAAPWTPQAQAGDSSSTTYGTHEPYPEVEMAITPSPRTIPATSPSDRLLPSRWSEYSHVQACWVRPPLSSRSRLRKQPASLPVAMPWLAPCRRRR